MCTPASRLGPQGGSGRGEQAKVRFFAVLSYPVRKFSSRKFSGSPSSTALIVVAARAVVQPAPEEEDLTKEGEGEQRWLLHVLYTVLSLRK